VNGSVAKNACVKHVIHQIRTLTDTSCSLVPDPMRVSDWGQLHLQLVWAYAGRPETPAASLCSNPMAAWLLLKGSVRVRSALREYVPRAGQWIILPSAIQSYTFTSDSRIISVRFRAEWLDGRQLFELTEPLVCEANIHPRLGQAARAIVRWVKINLGRPSVALSHQKIGMLPYLRLTEITSAWVKAYSAALLCEGFEANRAGSVDARVLQSYRQLSTHPLHKMLSIAELAGRNGLGRKQLERLFSTYTGTSMRSYFDRRRLEQAQRVLAHSRQPIKEVGLQLGFKQMSHFSTWFRRQTGYCPLEFRARGESAERSP
jgi:AraC-like DNA-binding protein